MTCEYSQAGAWEWEWIFIFFVLMVVKGKKV